MNYSIEVDVYKLNNPESDDYDEVPLEVAFDIFDENGKFSYDITGYYLDGKPVTLESFKDANPSLKRRIERAIERNIDNQEDENEV
jgi:uncharacterized protein (UPF0297 family)